jgi:hypothetical protein
VAADQARDRGASGAVGYEAELRLKVTKTSLLKSFATARPRWRGRADYGPSLRRVINIIGRPEAALAPTASRQSVGGGVDEAVACCMPYKNTYF